MSTDGSAIYDLGYRHYEGRRLGPWYAARALFVHSLLGAYGLRRATRSKIVPMLLLALALLPAVVIAVVINVQPVEELPLAYTSYAPVTWLLLTIFVASQAPQAVSRDLRFRTIALYLSRPLARGQYVLAKYAALTAAVFIFLAVPMTLMFVAALLTDLPVADQVRGWLAGLGGAVLFALVLSGISLVIAALTPRRGIGVGVIIAVLVLATGVVGTVQQIALEQGYRTLGEYVGMASPVSLVDGVQVWLFHSEPDAGVALHGNLVGATYLLMTLVLIAACFGALLLRYRKVLS